ncbi:hypothetical protein DSM104299_04837 [Baekduia alba]|uniref:hypothetical protein n=1 Tax=Baekduia alba TaxID=2997333 RepID=UPI002340B5FC|nr:hypothetical protein [Baekduia alba]WCB96082.1 hypothetical protein DSM104299_04837 [Baekduia alba]
MTRKTTREARTQLAGMLAIAAAGTAAYWVGEGAAGGLQAGAILFAFALLIFLGRRWSPTIETMSGVGDERTRALTQRAAAFSGYAMACVLAAWGLISAAAGSFNATVGAMSVVFAVTWIGACAWDSRGG